MIHYTIADSLGRIIGFGSCGDGQMAAQALPGMLVAEGTGDPLTQYIADGQIADKPTVDADAALLQDAKDRKWAEIKAAREAAFDAPLVTPYGTFDSDKTSRDNIADAVQLCDKLVARSMPSTIDFILYDNTTATLTAEEMGTVGLLLGQKVQTAYATASALRAAIEAAATINDVEAVTWPA